MTPYPFNVKTKLTQIFEYLGGKNSKKYMRKWFSTVTGAGVGERESERDINLIYYEI